MRDRVIPCVRLGLYPPPALDAATLQELERLVQQRIRLKPGACLYRMGDRFEGIYTVYAGALKSYRLRESGEEQVGGFRLPGEFLALAAISAGYHPDSAVALEPSLVCLLPYHELASLARRVPQLQRQLLRLLSGAIASQEELHAALVAHNAEERLAFMLLDLAERQNGRDSPMDTLHLSMSRADLGNAVGLAPETTSRVLRHFREYGWVRTAGRDVHLLCPQALHDLAARVMPPTRHSRQRG